MDYFFVTTVLNLECPTLPRSGIEIAPNMRLSTDVQHLLKNRISRDAYGLIGPLDKDELQSEQCFVVARAEPPKYMDMRPLSPDASVTHLALLDRLLAQLQIWAFGMWCLRDHSINTGTAFLEYPYKSPDSRLNQNHIVDLNTMADGQMRKIKFDKEELQFPMNFFSQTSPADDRISITMEEGVVGNSSEPKYDLERYKTSNRQQKAMNFVHIARGQSLLPYKIAMYISAMECLLSNRSDSDATEQIATRVAVLLDTYTELEGLEVYDGVKTAYNIRSRFIHGGVISKRDLSRLPDISMQCDQLLRRLLLICIGQPDVRNALDDDETLRQMFLRKMFQPVSRPEELV